MLPNIDQFLEQLYIMHTLKDFASNELTSPVDLQIN